MSQIQRQIAAIVALRELYIIKLNEEKKTKRKTIHRKYLAKPLQIKRPEHNLEARLLSDLLWDDDEKDVTNFTRLSVDKFEKMFGLVNEYLIKEDISRTAIPTRTKLALTLRYLATGNSYKSLKYMSNIAEDTIEAFIPDMLRAIYESLHAKYLKVPETEDEWLEIASSFNYLWQFPHTLGAIDGKHIRIKASANTEPNLYNFKGFYSIVLLALVDAHNRFIFIDVGCDGKTSDSTIFQDGYLGDALENGSLNIPARARLGQGRGERVPYFFIGGNNFSLSKHLMKPFSQNMELNEPETVFNYRISRARSVVDCAFWKLANRFNIFNTPLEVLPNTVDLIVLASCSLHNFLTKTKSTPMPEDFQMAESLPDAFSSLGPQTHSLCRYASRIREELMRYCVVEGNVDFQWKNLNIKPFS